MSKSQAPRRLRMPVSNAVSHRPPLYPKCPFRMQRENVGCGSCVGCISVSRFCKRLVPLKRCTVGANSRLKRHVQQEHAVLERSAVAAVKNQNSPSQNVELLHDSTCIQLLEPSSLGPRNRLVAAVPPRTKASRLEQFQCRCIVDCGETPRQTGNGEIVRGRSA